MYEFKAFILPHPESDDGLTATYQNMQRCAEKIADYSPETVIIISKHNAWNDIYFNISSPVNTENSDEELINAISELCESIDFPAGTNWSADIEEDIGSVTVKSLLEEAYKTRELTPDYKLLRVGCCGKSLSYHYMLGMLVKKASESLNRRSVVVVTGNFSHKQRLSGDFGYSPKGPYYDRKLSEILAENSLCEVLNFTDDFLDQAVECVHRPLSVLAGMFDETCVSCELYSHEFPMGIGYITAELTPEREDTSLSGLTLHDVWYRQHLKQVRLAESPGVKIARTAIETYVLKKDIPVELEHSETLDAKGACFVLIYQDGVLRGSIGSVSPRQDTLTEEIITNAVRAASADPRYPPITEKELGSIEIYVDVLSPMSPAENLSSSDPGKYGLAIVEKNDNTEKKRGAVLPGLPYITSSDAQLKYVKRMAGITDEEFNTYTFTVTRCR